MEQIVQLNSNAKLSEHFNLGEMTKSSSHPEVYNIPSHEAIANLKRVCGWLEVLRERYNERYSACHLEHYPSVMSSGVETSPKGDHEISPRASLGRDDKERMISRDDKGDSDKALEFKGIPYSSIIAEWWRRNGGEPAEGERNVKLHKLAVNLRAICDNRNDLLMQVMPRFGLTDAELKSVVDSACKEPPKGISKVMQQIIDALQLGISVDEIEDAEAVAEQTGVKVNVRSLPIGLKESLVGVPVSMHMPVLCGIMPIAATYADQVTVEYCDGNTQRRTGQQQIGG